MKSVVALPDGAFRPAIADANSEIGLFSQVLPISADQSIDALSTFSSYQKIQRMHRCGCRQPGVDR